MVRGEGGGRGYYGERGRREREGKGRGKQTFHSNLSKSPLEKIGGKWEHDDIGNKVMEESFSH